jgi:protein SCO1/2
VRVVVFDFVCPIQVLTARVPGVKVGRGVGDLMLGGPFELLDTDGNVVTDKDFHGRYMLVYFGFTHCPDICPTELIKMGKMMETLGTIFG